jgi:hypothetical protein
MNEGDQVKWNCPVSGVLNGTVIGKTAKSGTIVCVQDDSNLAAGKPIVLIQDDQFIVDPPATTAVPAAPEPAPAG